MASGMNAMAKYAQMLRWVNDFYPSGCGWGMYVDVGSGRESSRLVQVRLVFEATLVHWSAFYVKDWRCHYPENIWEKEGLMNPKVLEAKRRAAVHNYSREPSRQWEGAEEGYRDGASVCGIYLLKFVSEKQANVFIREIRFVLGSVRGHPRQYQC